jgi:GPH family glycoside/pentoside/hexuronide:cation symporter
MAIGLTFPLLAYIGFNPADGAHNSAAAIRGLELAFIVGPIVFVMLGACTVIGWKLGPQRHAEIREQLLVRDDVHRETPIMEVINPERAVAVPARAMAERSGGGRS